MTRQLLFLAIVLFLLASCAREENRSCPKRKGIVVLKYKNGRTRTKFYVENCLYNGSYYAFYPNGRSRCRGKFLNGKKFGNWKFRNPNGKLRAQYDYDSTGTAYSITRHGIRNTATIVQSTAKDQPFFHSSNLNYAVLNLGIKDSEWKTLDLQAANGYFILSSKHEFYIFDEALREQFNIRGYYQAYHYYTAYRSTYEFRDALLLIRTKWYDKQQKAWKEKVFEFVLR